jgi:hypothetical protein
MNLLTICFLTLMVTTGCVHSITDIDTSKKNQACVRECSGVYSRCLSGAFGIAAQNGCGDGFKVCSNSCPDK